MFKNDSSPWSSEVRATLPAYVTSSKDLRSMRPENFGRRWQARNALVTRLASQHAKRRVLIISERVVPSWAGVLPRM